MKRFWYSLASLLIIVAALAPAPVHAQALTAAERAKLAPRLRAVVADDAEHAPRPDAVRAGEAVYNTVVYTDDVYALHAAGIEVDAVFEPLVTARVTASDLVTLARLDAVNHVKTDMTFYPTNDVGSGLAGAHLLHDGFVGGTPYTGTDVVTCVIDSGIDWAHGDFRDPADQARSRILYLWDVTLTPQGAEQTPQDRDASLGCCDYGVEYTQADIEDELDGAPAGFVREQDTHGHGTHVAGTMAGNGAALPSQKYAGYAPEADLVIVKAGNGSFSGSDVINGMDYCGDVAASLGKPVVVNMSLGTDAGPHDGSSSLSQAINTFANDGTEPGRVVVIAAGNSGSDNIHTSGTLPANSTTGISLTVPSYTAASGTGNDDFEIDIWIDTDGSQNVDVTVSSPSGEVASQTTDGVNTTATADGAIEITNETDPDNTDRHVQVRVFDQDAGTPPAAGSWTITLQDQSGGAYAYHAWLFDYSIGSATVQLGNNDSEYTVGAPGTATHAITVGAFVQRWNWHNAAGADLSYAGTDLSDRVAAFSSRGPRRDEVQKPELVAAGQGTISSPAADAGVSSSRIMPGGTHYLSQGTSMASPAVAGAVALLLDHDATLTATEVKALLTDTAQEDDYTGAIPNSAAGYGKLDVFEAMVKALNASNTAQTEMLAYDEWGSSSFTTIDPGEWAAVRFTPTISGVVSGFFVHTGPSASVSAPLNVEIWADDGSGQPGTMIGSAVQYSADEVGAFSWNYLNLFDAGASVSAGSEYHIVLYPTGGGDALPVLLDDGASDGRSNLYTSGTWQAIAPDFRMRPVVSWATGVPVLPVELVAFEAASSGRTALLAWSTASETNSAGFEIQHRRGATSGWARVGWVDGHGTTEEPQSYTFHVEELEAGLHRFRLEQVDLDGFSTYSHEVEVRVETPGSFALTAAHPSPFRGATSFQLTLAEAQQVRVDVFDVLGRRVATLHDGALQADRPHTFTFDANGRPGGLYFVRAHGETFEASQSALLVR